MHTYRCYVYGLVDPRTSAVRYVGKTGAGFRGIKRRWYRHVEEGHSGVKTHKALWVATLLSAGLNPDIVVLDGGNWDAIECSRREVEMIKTLRGRGCDLTNTTDGGDGVRGVKLSAEETARRVARLVAANTGRLRTELARANMRRAWQEQDPEARQARMSKLQAGFDLWKPDEAYRAKLSEAQQRRRRREAEAKEKTDD